MAMTNIVPVPIYKKTLKSKFATNGENRLENWSIPKTTSVQECRTDSVCLYAYHKSKPYLTFTEGTDHQNSQYRHP